MERKERASWARGPAGAKQGSWELINNIWGALSMSQDCARHFITDL